MATPTFPPHRVRPLRERLALTQEQLAERVGVARSLVTHWESGLRTPSGPAALLLANLDRTSDSKRPKKNFKKQG